MISPPAPAALRVMCGKWGTGLLLAAMTACAAQPPAQTTALVPAAETQQQCVQHGDATWYSGTARGRTSRDELTAAHKTLPMGTLVHVTAVDTGQSVVVKINDRGPFARGRVIDLSRSAATQLGIRRQGVTEVRLEVEGATDQVCPFQEARLASE
jgi:rare lipoprotein A